MIRIRFHGRGGHGTKTASRIVGTAAFLAGYQAQDSPVYGAERRGAAVVAFTRIDTAPILERGVIEQPDFIVVTDETLLSFPDAGALANQASASAIFVNAFDSDEVARSNDIQVPLVTLDVTQITLETLGSASALSAGIGSAAARLTGVISREELISAMREEFSDLRLSDEEIAANVEVGQRVYGELSPVEIRGSAKGAHADLFDIPYSNPVLGSPSVLHAGSAIERKTGTWRVERPVIDTDVCTRCGLCYVRCPDGAIALDDEGFPVIDYDHCKGCMICRQVCPLRAVESERETKAW